MLKFTVKIEELLTFLYEIIKIINCIISFTERAITVPEREDCAIEFKVDIIEHTKCIWKITASLQKCSVYTMTCIAAFSKC